MRHLSLLKPRIVVKILLSHFDSIRKERSGDVELSTVEFVDVEMRIRKTLDSIAPLSLSFRPTGDVKYLAFVSLSGLPQRSGLLSCGVPAIWGEVGFSGRGLWTRISRPWSVIGVIVNARCITNRTNTQVDLV
jgi:hypothetical protein